MGFGGPLAPDGDLTLGQLQVRIRGRDQHHCGGATALDQQAHEVETDSNEAAGKVAPRPGPDVALIVDRFDKGLYREHIVGTSGEQQFGAFCDWLADIDALG